MNIDRARFLMLTGAISGAIAACVTQTTTTPDGGVPDTKDATTSDASNPTPDATGDSSDAAATDARESSTICDDSVGSLGPCVDYLDGGTGPADGGNGCLDQTACEAIRTTFKPKVGKAIVDCLVALPTCEGGAGIGACVQQELGNACPDNTARPACDEAAAACADAGADAGTSIAECTALLAGVTMEGRQAFISCASDSQCQLSGLACLTSWY